MHDCHIADQQVVCEKSHGDSLKKGVEWEWEIPAERSLLREEESTSNR